MVDTILRITRASNYRTVRQYLMFRAVTFSPTTAALFSPYLPWYFRDEDAISGFPTAVAAVPYSNEVGVSVVDALLRLAKKNTPGSYIPIDIWALLKGQPSLPPICGGRRGGTGRDVVHHFRRLGDLDILKSYFHLVWSEWDTLDDSGFAEMQLSIAEDLGGIGVWGHRKDLVDRLDHVLGELDQGLEYLRERKWWIVEDDIQMRKEQYGTLRVVLLAVDQKTLESLAGMSLVGWLV